MKKIKLKSIINKEKFKSKESFKNWLLILISAIGIGVLSLILLFALYIIIASPDFDQDLLYSKEATVIYDVTGKEEVARIGAENRALVDYEDLPQVLIDALIATEDSRFFQHNGLDAARFLKASLGQALHQSTAGGASTLSMQVIKNTYTDDIAHGIRGIIRKFTDIYMAVFKLESNYTKEEIIEFYVNSHWLGNDGNLNYTGIYGVEQASQYYFGKSVRDLNLSEASLLVGMFQNPNLYNPYLNPNNATKRRSTVLSLMVKHGYITKEEKDAAEDITVKSMLAAHAKSTSNAQAFIDYLLKDVEEKTGSNPYTTPMRIYSTIDTSAQAALSALENGELYTFKDDVVQIGVAVTSVKDGSIVALCGGRNYSAKGLNRATDISRQPGSTAKILFDYGPYIEFLNGSTGSLFLDEPTTYSNGTPITNYDNIHKGLLTMREALKDSRNIPALLAFKAVSQDNQENIKNFVHSLGIDYGKDLFESASIGGFSGVSPLQMSAAYSAFARGGYYIAPYSFTKIEYVDSSKIYEYKYTKEQVMSEETAYLITDILLDAGASNVGGSLKISGTDIGAKTGTTTVDKNSRESIGLPNNVVMDYWNITFSPDYNIALWYGYDNLSKDHYLHSESNVRKRIMEAIGRRIYKKNSQFKKPSGVVSVTLEKETFPLQRASAYTPADLKITELFKRGTEPSESEISTRFSQLANPTNGTYAFDGLNIKLSWDPIQTPDAINPTYLQNYFNTYYGNSASKYYEQRIAYNNAHIGSLGYQVYLKSNDGNLVSLGYTVNNSFTYTPSSAGTYTFIIKSAYNYFKDNMSSGITIEAKANIDSNVNDLVDTTNLEQKNN